jgi:hypothetical protein
LLDSGYAAGQPYELEVTLTGATLGAGYATPTCTEPPSAGEAYAYVPCDSNGFALELDAAGGALSSLCAAAPVDGACPPPSASDDEVVIAPSGDAAFANRPHDPARPYVVTANGRATWHLWWTAPPAGTGTIALYVSAVDGNGGSGRADTDADPYGDDAAATKIEVRELGAAASGCAIAGRGGGGALLLPLFFVATLLLRRRALALMACGALAGCDYTATMLPGEDCQGCHANFGASGTIFARSVAAAEDGRRDAIVTITDATGRIAELVSNETGNFYTKERLVPPLRAEVTLGPTTRHMEPSVDVAGCNSCHANPPEGGAAGRIQVIPVP